MLAQLILISRSPVFISIWKPGILEHVDIANVSEFGLTQETCTIDVISCKCIVLFSVIKYDDPCRNRSSLSIEYDYYCKGR